MLVDVHVRNGSLRFRISSDERLNMEQIEMTQDDSKRPQQVLVDPI